jgi:hypothetical protein
MTLLRLLFLSILFFAACDERARGPRSPRNSYDWDGGEPRENGDAAAPAPSITAQPGDVHL